MQAILVQQGLVEALKGETRMSPTLSQKEKNNKIDKARSVIISCLDDKALREVAREKTAAAMWVKLESLNMTKSLVNRLCLKQQLYSFKLTKSRSITEQLADFNKILDDLEEVNFMIRKRPFFFSMFCQSPFSISRMSFYTKKIIPLLWKRFKT